VTGPQEAVLIAVLTTVCGLTIAGLCWLDQWLDRRADARTAVRQAEQAVRDAADRAAWESIVARLEDQP